MSHCNLLFSCSLTDTNISCSQDSLKVECFSHHEKKGKLIILAFRVLFLRQSLFSHHILFTGKKTSREIILLCLITCRGSSIQTIAILKITLDNQSILEENERENSDYLEEKDKELSHIGEIAEIIIISRVHQAKSPRVVFVQLPRLVRRARHTQGEELKKRVRRTESN